MALLLKLMDVYPLGNKQMYIMVYIQVKMVLNNMQSKYTKHQY
jgi:hypothetical protein